MELTAVSTAAEVVARPRPVRQVAVFPRSRGHLVRLTPGLVPASQLELVPRLPQKERPSSWNQDPLRLLARWLGVVR